MSAQIRPGYKLTEAGVIPEDWSCISLATLATSVASGRSKPDAIYGEYPVYGSTGIIGNTDNASHAGEVILVARVGANAGKLNLVTGKFGVTDNTIIIRLKDNLCLPFFYLQLERKNLNSLVFGSGQPLITGTQLKALAIPMPELHEQRIIAAALSDTDTLISGLDQLIAKKRDIKQATLQQLLTGQQRLPGFSGEWEMKRLGDIGVFLKGSGVRRDQSLSGDLPCIRYGEIYTTHNDYIREFKSYISVAVSKEAARIECGDIMFAGSGETKEDIGKCVSLIDDIEAYAGGDIVILRPKNVDSLFLGYALNTPKIRHQKASRGQGDAVVHISANALATIEVLMPNQAEQTAIANILSDMDGELATLETQRNKISQLKQGAMQQLLSGKIRLSNKDKRI